MTYASIKTLMGTLATTLSCSYTYYQFDEGTAPAPPYFVFYYDGQNDQYADNLNYKRIRTLVIEFYSDYKDIDMEYSIEDFLDSNSMTYDKDEVYISSEKLYQTVYTMEVTINGKQS